ncbi:MAG TPA: hypothetical protein VF794_36105 [Archangium sp.]|uniref:hypothetical protein n=1 Tax=Archangium sp. TaxID=1872627 RepID=UPI002ED78661
MKLNVPSFLLGCGAGVGTVLLGKQLHPLLLEVATALYRFTDSVMTKTSMMQETRERLLAEARARARLTSKP